MKFEGEDIYVPADEIPQSSCVPPNTYEVWITDIDVTYSREKHLRMVQVHFEVASGPFEGTALQIGPYVLGTEMDPEARDPELWRKPQTHKAYGVLRWGKLLEAIDLKAGSMLFETCTRAIGRHFFAIVTVNKDENPSSPFYLSERNQIPDNGYFKLSQRPMAGGGVMGGASVPPPMPRERGESLHPHAAPQHQDGSQTHGVPRPVMTPAQAPQASAENGSEDESDDDIPF